MLGQPNQGRHLLTHFLWRLHRLQKLLRPLRAGFFIVMALRLIDDIVTPEGKFDGCGPLDQWTHAVKMSQTLCQVLQGVIGAV